MLQKSLQQFDLVGMAVFLKIAIGQAEYRISVLLVLPDELLKAVNSLLIILLMFYGNPHPHAQGMRPVGLDVENLIHVEQGRFIIFFSIGVGRQIHVPLSAIHLGLLDPLRFQPLFPILFLLDLFIRHNVSESLPHSWPARVATG
jgi:hypothetical protein